MALRNLLKCNCCDKKVGELSPVRKWCDQCEVEFAEWRARLPVECPGDCVTPISCRIMKRCLLSQAVIESKAPDSSMPTRIMSADRTADPPATAERTDTTA